MTGPDYAPAALPLREAILGALAEAFITRRVGAGGHCAGCGPGLCDEHAEDLAAADVYEAAYAQVAVGSAAWCDLAVTLAAGMN